MSGDTRVGGGLTRRQLLAGAARGAAAVALGGAGLRLFTGCRRRVTKDPPRHVFLVTVDTLRADHLGCYGYRRRDISPHIDRLAREGVLFEQAMAQASWTKASFGSILTGLFPHHHGAIDREDLLPAGAVTLPQRLAELGFTTIAVVANAWVGVHFGFSKGFRVFKETYGAEHPTYVTTAQDVNRELWAILDKTKAERLFVWLVYIDPHDPYSPPGRWARKYTDPGFPAGWPRFPPSPKRACPLVVMGSNGRPEVRTAPAGECINLYDGEIAYTDHHIGQLMEGLARRGLDDDSLIVFTTDHGEEFMEHGGWHHGGSLYQEQVRVPLVFRYPPGLGPGARIGGVASTVDIMPTVLEAVGAPAPPGDGASLLTSMRDRRAQERVAYAEETLHNAPGGWNFVDLRCVRRGRHKLIHVLKQVGGYARPDVLDAFRLYDLHRDPYERKNIWQEAYAAEAKADLVRLLKGFSAPAPQPARTRRSARGLPPEVRKNLKALGYLQ